MKSIFHFCILICTLIMTDNFPIYFASEGMGMGWNLKLNHDSTYTYYFGSDVSSHYSEGYWRQSGDTLILNSYNSPKIVSVTESVHVNSKKLKIFILGSDNRDYAFSHLYYDGPDSSYSPQDRPDLTFFEEMVESDSKIGSHPHLMPLSQLSKVNRHFWIRVDDYELGFSIQDTSTNIVIVRLNISKTIEIFNQKEYFKDRPFLRRGDTLFLYSNIKSSYYTRFPAIRKRTN